MTTRVAVVYNEPKADPTEEHWIWKSDSDTRIAKDGFHDASEYGVLDEVRLIAGFLTTRGYDIELFAVEDPSDLADFLKRYKPDVIFNCCESFRGKAALEMNVAAVYELFNVPYTGTPALSLGICLNKGLAKAVFRAHGVPTPGFVVVHPKQTPESARVLSFPLIVKPIAEDASIGIDRHCVVHSEAALNDRVSFVHDQFHQAALVEEFIEGRELNIALLAKSPTEFEALPISEIIFEGLPDSYPKILSYESKWLTRSDVYKATMPKCPADLEPALAERLRKIAVEAAICVGLKDYGRVDFRLRQGDNAIFVLEVNPNPDITFDSGFVRAAEATGRSHGDAVCEILERALERRS
jgi:D-alanine-D-alanine ligase